MNKMRRGSLSNSSIFLVVCAAIFAIASFIFDQLVIQYEDKVRTQNSNYQSMIFDAINASELDLNLKNLGLLSHAKASGAEFQNQFLYKVSTLRFDDKYMKRTYSEAIKINNNYLKEQFETYKSIISIHYNRVMAENIMFQRLIESYSLEDFDEFKKHQLKINAIFNKVDHNKNQKFSDKTFLKTFLNEKKNYKTIWENINALVITYDKVREQLTKMELIAEKLYDEKIKEAEQISKKISKLKSTKNFFILFSVLFQILSLTALLILFRSIVDERLKD
tara:strand:- start:65 stop:898 length:834 start_codon:yes stop_codon:yes gene_type:complete